ncbi:MAG: hypothetical protein ACJ771_10460 [Chloroflexota bacterium]
MGPSTQSEVRPSGHSLITALLDPGEEVEHEIAVGEKTVAVTTNRIAIVEADRVTLSISIADIKRIELDIEKDRSGMLVIVPDESIDHPGVLTFDRDGCAPAGTVLVTVGRRLATS